MYSCLNEYAWILTIFIYVSKKVFIETSPTKNSDETSYNCFFPHIAYYLFLGLSLRVSKPVPAEDILHSFMANFDTLIFQNYNGACGSSKNKGR
jgi:hypothetical protein